jgi:transcriptional regulator with XRE-family HTH domain
VNVSVPIDIDAQIGARLAEVRRRCGLTQRQLAAAIGVTPVMIKTYENGRSAIPVRRFDALANALHCEPIYLLMLPGTDLDSDEPRVRKLAEWHRAHSSWFEEE